MIEGRLPPLNALRAFEAAARHLSVKNAAAELCVTPGAVSQMLKTLELHLGTELFHRVNRGILLTEAGQNYLPSIRNAFRQMAEATERVATAADTTLTVIGRARCILVALSRREGPSCWLMARWWTAR